MTNLSEHFTLEELVFSQAALRNGLDNTPDAAQVANLSRLCATLLEPGRALVAVPWHIDSGYRSPLVNANIGGAPDSAHMEGRAADVIPMLSRNATLWDAFEVLHHSQLPYDQIIFECRAWIHLSAPPQGQTPRRQALVATGGPGHWNYELIK